MTSSPAIEEAGTRLRVEPEADGSIVARDPSEIEVEIVGR